MIYGYTRVSTDKQTLENQRHIPAPQSLGDGRASRSQHRQHRVFDVYSVHSVPPFGGHTRTAFSG